MTALRGGASLGTTGAKPDLIFGEKQFNGEKQSVYCIYNLHTERR
jgi:hypothetical protein